MDCKLLREIVDTAGKRIGLGDFRPRLQRAVRQVRCRAVGGDSMNHPLAGLAVLIIWCGMILGLIASI
jgi:hypothetical protein